MKKKNHIQVILEKNIIEFRINDKKIDNDANQLTSLNRSQEDNGNKINDVRQSRFLLEISLSMIQNQKKENEFEMSFGYPSPLQVCSLYTDEEEDQKLQRTALSEIRNV